MTRRGFLAALPLFAGLAATLRVHEVQVVKAIDYENRVVTVGPEWRTWRVSERQQRQLNRAFADGRQWLINDSLASLKPGDIVSWRPL